MNNVANFVKKELCTGCSCCAFVCPNNALKIIEDERGFLKRTVNKEKCINCGLCLKVCHICNNQQTHKEKQLYYGGYSKDKGIHISSRSGGIFALLAHKIIDEGGVVYGSTLTEDYCVKHILISSHEDVWKLQGSKYVQSHLSMKKQLIDSIKKKRKCLISGTPCQIAALKLLVNYIRLDNENIYFVDLICHGTPSQKFWKSHFEYEYDVNDILSYNFRDKTYGWDTIIESCFSRKRGKIRSEIFSHMFGSHLVLTDNCFHCSYRSLSRPGDITLGDYWNNNDYHSDKYSPLGNSVVLVNSDSGRRLINSIFDQAFIYTIDNPTELLQAGLSYVYAIPEKYNHFWKLYTTKGYKYCKKEYFDYFNYGFISKIRRKIKSLLG